MVDTIVLFFGGWLFALTISAIKLWIEFKSLQNSTHRVTYIDPLSQQFSAPLTDEEKKAMSGDPFGNIN